MIITTATSLVTLTSIFSIQIQISPFSALPRPDSLNKKLSSWANLSAGDAVSKVAWASFPPMNSLIGGNSPALIPDDAFRALTERLTAV